MRGPFGEFRGHRIGPLITKRHQQLGFGVFESLGDRLAATNNIVAVVVLDGFRDLAFLEIESPLKRVVRFRRILFDDSVYVAAILCGFGIFGLAFRYFGECGIRDVSSLTT